MSAISAEPLIQSNILTLHEVSTILAKLTPPEWRILRRTADVLGRRVDRRDREDILQEACSRMIAGSRKVRRDISFYRAITGVMRSLVSAETEALEGDRRPVVVPPDWLALHPDERLSPEQVAIDHQRFRAMLERLFDAIGNDPDLVALAEAELDGFYGDALRRHLDVTSTELATLKRKLARRIAPWSMSDRSVPRLETHTDERSGRKAAPDVRRGDLGHEAKDQSSRYREDLGSPDQVCLFRRGSRSAVVHTSQRRFASDRGPLAIEPCLHSDAERPHR